MPGVNVVRIDKLSTGEAHHERPTIDSVRGERIEPPDDTSPAQTNVIEMRKVSTRFGSHVVHTEIDLEVRRAEIFALIGGSGSGKSTLLREMIMLHRPDAGTITVLGNDLGNLSDEDALALRQRWGVMFQHGGLFGSLTVKENIGLPLREHTDLSDT